MEDTIEVCSGCGKMPRPIDFLNGQFLCSRCGNAKTMLVNSDDYEKVVTDLDNRFHSKIIESRVAVIKSEGPNPGRKKKKPAKKAAAKKAKKPKKKAVKKKPKAKKKAAKKPSKKARKPARKAAKKKPKKAVKKKKAKRKR